MKTIPAVYEEDASSMPSNDDKASILLNEFLAASVETNKLKKKIRREESKVDRLGYASKKIDRLKDKLEYAFSRKTETLAELHELQVA